MRKSNLRSRIITSGFIGAILIGGILFGDASATIILLGICFLCALEFWRLDLPEASTAIRITLAGIVTGPGIYVGVQHFTTHAEPDYFVAMALVALAFGIVTLTSMISTQTITKAGGSGVLLFGTTGVFALYTLYLDPFWLLGIFFLLWSYDVFAYVTGSAIGKTKLAPQLSPGKTWEGVIGGAVMTLIAAWIISRVFALGAVSDWLILAALVVIFGTLGDLLQSAFKRASNAKDSGSLLPGHGGFWDRFDSFVGCIPWCACYLITINV